MSARTVTQRVTASSLIKPGELVDVVELTPLQLTDRRTYNLLLGAAWDRIEEDTEHSISKRELRTKNSKANGRLDESIGRLMGARVRVKIERDGKEYIRSMSLLETVEEPVRSDGLVYYRFPRKLRELIADSSIFARLHKDVMLHLTSKYSLALYEMIQKRGNLEHKTTEEFSVKELRELLGVPKDKLMQYKSFKQRALIPAIEEVHFLANFGVDYQETRKGRTVTSITLMWRRKSQDEMKEVYSELRRSKVGRKVRIKEQGFVAQTRREEVLASLPE